MTFGLSAGRDRNGARLHGLRQLTYEVDVQQAVLEARAPDHDVVGELEPALEAATGNAAMQIGGLFQLGLLLAASRERVLLHLDVGVLLSETSDGHADTILILADALDVVGRVGVSPSKAPSVSSNAPRRSKPMVER